ncbi:MAG: hypothetical protein VKK80_07300 [Prochlorothrix sp.]|nr:hypothetical protein [Prochlorothrix sp.]
MATLQQILTHPDRRSQVVADLMTLMAEEVKQQQGLFGILVRKCFDLFKKLEGGYFIERAITMMLPEGAKALDPYYQSYCKLGDHRPSFGDYLGRSGREVTEAILAITDRRRDQSNNPVLVMTYNGLRSQVVPILEREIPALGAVLARHALAEAARADASEKDL